MFRAVVSIPISSVGSFEFQIKHATVIPSQGKEVRRKSPLRLTGMLVLAPSSQRLLHDLDGSIVSLTSYTSAIRTRIVVVVVVRHEQGQTKDGGRVARTRSINVSDGLEKRVARVYEEEWCAW